MSPQRTASLLLLVCASWQITQAGYIHAKAAVAQRLLERAWERSLHGARHTRPWPWADTWPIARLKAPRLDIDFIVLAGASGRSLAFGPSHVDGSVPPGLPGNSVIAGHRDTHFAFVRDLVIGDELQLETMDEMEARYRVTDLSVLDARTDRLSLDGERDALILVTCFPFDAVAPGGPLRFRVTADRVSLSSHARVAGRRRVSDEPSLESKVTFPANEVM